MADSLTVFKNQVRALDLSNVMSKNNCKIASYVKLTAFIIFTLFVHSFLLIIIISLVQLVFK